MGILPDGDTQSPDMPRWEMSDADMNELIAFLKNLPWGSALVLENNLGTPDAGRGVLKLSIQKYESHRTGLK